MNNALATAAARRLYEVAYRDDDKVRIAHTLAISAQDAMGSFVFPVRATLVGDGRHHDNCGCIACNEGSR